MKQPEYFIVVRPLPGNRADECGDAGFVLEFDDKMLIVIIDGVGHGKEASIVAVACREYLEGKAGQDLVAMMKGLHEHIRGSRGAVVGIGCLDLKTGELKFVGIGNITLAKFGSTAVKIVPRLGIVGYIISDPVEEIVKLHDGDVLLLYTDGVREHFDLKDYPELPNDSAETIANLIITEFGKDEDDAACIALRYRG
jgi:serine phosphatase RsbU (regulator of sigma subunit)